MLTSDMLLLRQLSATGLLMLLMPLWRQQPEQLPAARSAGGSADERKVDPAAVAAAAAALREAVLADAPAFTAALFQQLAHGHPLLGGDAAQQRSGRQAGIGADAGCLLSRPGVYACCLCLWVCLRLQAPQEVARCWGRASGTPSLRQCSTHFNVLHSLLACLRACLPVCLPAAGACSA